MTAHSSVEGNPASNEEVYRALARHVATELLGVSGDDPATEIEPLSVNYFSFTFTVTVGSPPDRRTVFVKIPKSDLRRRSPMILPITAEDRRKAEDEEASLRLVGTDWSGDDLRVRWVRLRGVVPAYNALVTDRAYGDEVVTAFRRMDLRRRFGARRDGARICDTLGRFGAALGRFHRAHGRPATYQLRDALPKFEFYCRELAGLGAGPWVERVRRTLRSLDESPLDTVEVRTLKGIDIRNMLIDERDGLHLFDPGKAKRTHREADLARFAMTYRILYWGSPLLLVTRTPDPHGEDAFLRAYYSTSQPPSPRVLDLYLLKEQLKHWHTALDSLHHLPWSSTRKRLVARVYVTPFYARQLATTLDSLEA